VGVLHDHQQWSIGGDIREEVEDGHRNPEVLGRRLVRKAKSGIERSSLDGTQFARPVAHGSQQLM
jgi:hypothetical protein